jgi:hypothetical protein
VRTRKLLAVGASPERTASTAAATVAIGAVACGVCCVLPFALPAVVLAASGSVLAVFAKAFWGALYLATAMVAAAWLWVIVDTRRSRKRPARATLRTMAVATAALAGAAVWPTVEPHVIATLKDLFR